MKQDIVKILCHETNLQMYGEELNFFVSKTVLKIFWSSILSAVVADRGQWMSCVISHVHTDRLLVWDTLEDFFATLTL